MPAATTERTQVSLETGSARNEIRTLQAGLNTPNTMR